MIMQDYTLDFLYMRHGESVDNAQHIVPFNKNCLGLSNLGKEQAKAAINNTAVIGFSPDIIICSPLRRAKETAEIMADGLSIPAMYSDLIQEQDMGLWEGKKWSEVMPHLEAGQAPPKGEDFSTFDDRVDKALRYFVSIHPRKALIITHGGFWYSICKRYSKSSIKMPNNAEIRKVIFRNGVLMDEASS